MCTFSFLLPNVLPLNVLCCRKLPKDQGTGFCVDSMDSIALVASCATHDHLMEASIPSSNLEARDNMKSIALVMSRPRDNRLMAALTGVQGTEILLKGPNKNLSKKDKENFDKYKEIFTNTNDSDKSHMFFQSNTFSAQSQPHSTIVDSCLYNLICPRNKPFHNIKTLGKFQSYPNGIYNSSFF